MNKYIEDDAERLIEYFESYELKHVFSNKEFVDEYRKVHKKVLGYLVVFSEIDKQNIDKHRFQEQALYYLKESVSDVLQSFFIWVNGAYKGADLLLRSSIENFNKAIIGNVNSDVYTEKSVYKIFDYAKLMKEYQILIGKEKMVEVLHRIYSELCKSTHTATTDDMDHITALKLLPMYEPQKTKEYRKMFEIILDTYLGFFLANHRDIVNDMYRCNEDLFYDILSKNVIRSVITC